MVDEIGPVTECQSQEDKVRNCPILPRLDEMFGFVADLDPGQVNAPVDES